MKKTPRPYSQLILFSSQLERRIDKWFSGSVIFEVSLNSEIKNFEELSSANETLRLFNEHYSKATIVINPNEIAITLCQMTGKFPRIIYIVGESGYSKFFSYCRFVNKFFGIKDYIRNAKSEALCMKRSRKFEAHEPISLYNPSSSLSKLLEQHQSYVGQIRSVLNDPFV